MATVKRSAVPAKEGDKKKKRLVKGLSEKLIPTCERSTVSPVGMSPRRARRWRGRSLSDTLARNNKANW